MYSFYYFWQNKPIIPELLTEDRQLPQIYDFLDDEILLNFLKLKKERMKLLLHQSTQFNRAFKY